MTYTDLHRPTEEKLDTGDLSLVCLKMYKQKKINSGVEFVLRNIDLTEHFLCKH